MAMNRALAKRVWKTIGVALNEEQTGCMARLYTVGDNLCNVEITHTTYGPLLTITSAELPEDKEESRG